MGSSSIADALFTQSQQRVLGLLFSNPQKSFYTNEILRWSGMGVGTVRRELERLQGVGVLVVSTQGNQRHYQANPDCPIYAELHGIVLKTFGIRDVIATALEDLLEDIELAFVYGSVAKGTATANSDIDLMVVTEGCSYAELMEALAPAEASLGRPIHPTLYNRNQLANKLKDKQVFLRRVMEQPKLWIKGTDDDIGSHE